VRRRGRVRTLPAEKLRLRGPLHRLDTHSECAPMLKLCKVRASTKHSARIMGTPRPDQTHCAGSPCEDWSGATQVRSTRAAARSGRRRARGPGPSRAPAAPLANRPAGARPTLSTAAALDQVWAGNLGGLIEAVRQRHAGRSAPDGGAGQQEADGSHGGAGGAGVLDGGRLPGVNATALPDAPSADGAVAGFAAGQPSSDPDSCYNETRPDRPGGKMHRVGPELGQTLRL
jgi:hypothetical protein